MFGRTFQSFFRSRKNQPIVNAHKVPKQRRKVHLGIELLEDRVTPSTITQWNFAGTPAVINTQNGSTGNTVNQFAVGVEPTTGSGSIYTLGMYNAYNGGNSASDDVISTPGTAEPTFSENTLRVRGTTHNGWATHAAGAAQYTQGLEVDSSTAGSTSVSFSFDWYSTTQGIRDLQVQYNTNVNNAAGWTNFVAPGGTGSNGISTSGTFLATANDYWNATSTNGADPITVTFGSYANNDPNFGVRLVSAYDSTGNVPNDYASAALSGGNTVIYNNSSGNWRFDNLTFSAGAAASTTSALTESIPAPQVPGTSITLTDTITGGSGIAAGTVQFFDGVTQIGTTQNIAQTSGSSAAANITINTSGSPLTVGTHNFTAKYFAGGVLNSTTPNVAYTIGDPTSSAVTASPNSPEQQGLPVTFTDTVTPANIGGTSSPAGTPTGTVQFYDGTTPLGSAMNVTAGSGSTSVATYTDNGTLASGTHNISAVFTASSGSNFLNSTSPSLGYSYYSGSPGVFTPGNLVILQAGDGVNQYNAQAPLFLNEVNPNTGANVQQVAIPATAGVGNANNQPITIDLSSAAGNGQLNRSYDGSALSFDGVDSTINNGGLTGGATPSGSNNRVIAVVTGDPTQPSDINTTTYGPFYVGDDNRGSVAESPTGPIYAAGHPNQAGGAVSQGVHEFDTEGPGIGTQVSASTNIRGVTIGFDNRMYFTTAGGLGGATALNTAGIFTEAQALPTSSTATPANDIQVVPAIFGASKLGGVYFADVNGDGVVDNGDRLYFLDDGSVGGAGTGGLYVSTWNDSNTQNPWNTPNNAAAAAA